VTERDLLVEADPPQRDRSSGQPLVEVDALTVTFSVGDQHVRAVDGVSLTVNEGDIFALVGESGCGKSTLALSLLAMVPPPGKVSQGDVRFRGQSILQLSLRELNRLRGAQIGVVFQSAMNALNPVITIGKHVDHMLEAHGDVFPDWREGREYFRHLLSLARLDPNRVERSFESQLSGGMKQRVSIALSLLLKPSLIVLDEPTTALDVWNQRFVMAILRDLHRALGITIVFVTHDLAVVAELAHRVGVMYAGKLVEYGEVRYIFTTERRHPYASGLIGAIPSIVGPGRAARPIPGQVPNLAELPAGCRFSPRCPLAEARCREEEPALLADSSGHAVACHVVNRESGGTSPWHW
jgi:peptide/nickel transport system ATP-binding protein